MPVTLSNQGADKVDATERTNAVDQLTSILDFSPIDGMVLEISNLGGAGFPLALDLEDSNGDDLPQDTKVVIRYDAPHLDQPRVVSETLSNIQTYRTLSIKEQQNEEYIDQTRISLKGRALRVRDIDDVQIAIESDTQIDWANSRAYIDKRAVTVRSEE